MEWQVQLPRQTQILFGTDNQRARGSAFDLPGGLPVVVGAEDVVADQPTGGAADEHVRGEVLLTQDAGERKAAGESVDPNLLPPGWVFGGEDCG